MCNAEKIDFDPKQRSSVVRKQSICRTEEQSMALGEYSPAENSFFGKEKVYQQGTLLLARKIGIQRISIFNMSNIFNVIGLRN